MFQGQDASQYPLNKLNLIISSFATVQMSKRGVNQVCHSGKRPVQTPSPRSIQVSPFLIPDYHPERREQADAKSKQTMAL